LQPKNESFQLFEVKDAIMASIKVHFRRSKNVYRTLKIAKKISSLFIGCTASAIDRIFVKISRSAQDY